MARTQACRKVIFGVFGSEELGIAIYGVDRPVLQIPFCERELERESATAIASPQGLEMKSVQQIRCEPDLRDLVAAPYFHGRYWF